MAGRSPVRLGLGGEARRRSASDPSLSAWRFAFLAWADARWGPVRASADLEVASRALDGGRHDLEVLWAAEIGWRLARGIAIVLRGTHDRVASSAPELSFVRPTAELLLRLETSLDVGREELPRYRPRPGDGGRWRFLVRAPGARTVSVVGSFNAWDASRGRLRRSAGGEWAGDVTVPAGRHRYLFLVDGAPARPPDAEAYSSDGFGGEDGVLHAP
ncbi:MAG: hypothetical protein HYY06_22040 [Deltaproteobacteria bacterium]|nr:hypothetical protein [Deltaproteobacteria bacterium]